MITSQDFYSKSIGSALSAIEIYNKPDFSQRSEVFSILIVNAWEALLKGKLLLDNNEEITSIYVSDNKGGYKTNRTGNPLTLEVIGCAKKLSLPEILIENLSSLIEIRDNSIHFVNKGSVDYLVFSLGTASLKNYHRLCKEWFGESIDKYNFYILPMGFVYNFKSIKLIDLKKEPETIQQLLQKIDQQHTAVNNTQFVFGCEIEVVLKSAKKITEDTSFEIAVNPNSEKVTAIIKDVEPVEKYPLTATELFMAVKKKIPDISRNEFFKYLKDHGIKDDNKYSSYLFRNLRQKKRYEKDRVVPNGISSLYNHDCYHFVISDLTQKNE